MDLLPRNYAERCVQLSRKVHVVLHDITDTVRLSSDWDLKENVRRWADLLAMLVEDIHQKGGLLGGYEADGIDNVFLVLALGMHETVDWLRDVLVEEPSPQTPHTLEQLKARVALHEESIALMSAHLDRECSRYLPNAQMELSKMDAKWFDQKAHLEARLKDVFQCSSSALLWSRSAATQETAEAFSLLPTSPSTPPFPTSISFLAVLQVEAAKSLPGFPQTVALKVVMRASIYLLNTLRISLNDIGAGSTDEIKFTRLYVNSYKCGWVVHNLINHYQLRTTHGGIKQVIELILEVSVLFIDAVPSFEMEQTGIESLFAES